MSANLTSLLPILVVIVTLYSPVSSVTTCTNYVNGVEDTRECAYACCLSGGSYAINLNETEVCADENQKCYNDKLTIPTSCPIKVHEEFEMYECGVSETCCYPLNEPVPEFEHQVPRKNAVCTSDVPGNCIKYNGQDGFDIWGQEDLKNYQDDSSLTSRNVYCYENCMSVISSSVFGLEIELEDLADLNWPSCSKENVSSCSATTEEVCLFLDVSFKADITVPTPQGFITTPGDMDIRAFYCGKLDDDIKPEIKCNIVKEQFTSLSDTLYAVSTIELSSIQIDCGKLDMCVENCVYEEHRPKKKKDCYGGGYC
ncbi:uncharacterized protein LOC134814267 [Bolinopsis microptera]|uniref:uncharacterized protein LOC134814267 n=1 Tax=Bolinopsis microptera TaxID=2820187 RepID=UPI003079964B